MSSAAALFLSSAAACQSRYSLLASIGVKDCRCVTSSGYRGYQCSVAKPGIARGRKENASWEESKKNRSIAAKAGLGRFSGAIHGNSQRKSRRRKQSGQQEQDVHEEMTDGSEVRHPNSQEQSDDNNSGQVADGTLGDDSPDDSQTASYERYVEEIGEIAWLHDDGVSSSIGSGDVSCNDGSPDLSQESESHSRYLQELGVSVQVRDDGESPSSSKHLPREQDFDKLRDIRQGGYQTHACSRMSDGSSWQTVGAEGDLGYEQFAKASSAQERIVRSDRQISSSYSSSGMSNGPAWVAGAGEARDLKSGLRIRRKKTDGENLFLDEIAPVAATVLTNPDLFQETSSSEINNINSDFDEAISGFSSVQNTNSSIITVEGSHEQAVEVERRAGLKDSRELPGTSDSVSGLPMRKKQVKKPKKKPAASTSSLKFEEKGDNYQRVRVVAGEAERPAIATGVTEPCQFESRPEEVLAMNSSVTSLNFPATLVEPQVTRIACEELEKATRVEMDMERLTVADTKYSDVLIVKGLDNTGEELPRKLESSSLKDTNYQDNPSNQNLQDGPWTAMGEAGAAVISVHPAEGPGEQEELVLSKVASAVVEQVSQVGSLVVDTVVEQAVQVAKTVVPDVVVEQAVQVASKVAEIPVVVVDQVVKILPEVVTEQVGQVLDQAVEFQSQAVDHVSTLSEQVVQLGQKIADQVSETGDSVVGQVSDAAEKVVNIGQMIVDQVSETGDSVVEQVSDVAEQVANTVSEQVQQVTGTVSSTALQITEQVADFFADDDDDTDSDDEFEAYKTSDLPEFRGKQGLDNFIVKQEGQGVLSRIYDFYTYMLKQSLPEFAAAMFAAPILVSAIFTLLYLPEFEGLAFDETARDFFAAAGGDASILHISWKTIFQVFMFSLSLSTGLQPELAPLSPYTLVVANLNALVAQLVFVFLSGAVFARLSQPSQPVRCSMVALVSTSAAQRKRKENAIKVLMARYVLAGPQPCELVDVKVDLTYKYNTITRTGSYFRATQSLKLVRPEIAFLTHGMLVRHVIDDSSPLYQRTPEMLKREDAVFCLSVVGLERASMQSVFHVQHYCVVDDHVIWDAEFEDIILINKKNKRVVDHSRLSMWRSFRN